jgi:DNA-binding SARP family transcriptional activator/tetratricopeptide (TPR) repeat protein
LRFGVLGSLEVITDSGDVADLGGTQPRTLLAMLLVASGRIVPVDALIEEIWGERVPDSAGSTLQSYISRLRRELEPERSRGAPSRLLVWEPPGYKLDVQPDDVDFRRFERLADEGRERLRAGQLEEARARLVDAASLWRGDALGEFSEMAFARGVATRLEERRQAALEDRLEVDLALGRHAAIVGELTELVGRHPLREGLWAHLAVALYRSGRQSDALRALDDMRVTLREELGVDPSRPLRELETAILGHDPSLDIAPPAATPTPAPTAAPVDEVPAVPVGPQLVGRTPELERLANVLTESRAGRSRFVVIQGEPGIGKTSVLEAVAAMATAKDAFVAWGRCYEGGAAPAFWPWLEVLRPLADRFADEWPDDERLSRLLSATATTSDTVGIDRFGALEAVALLLEHIAARTPLVVIIDDLQWADPASLELVEFVAGRPRERPFLLAVSVRDVEVGRNSAVVGALSAIARRAGSVRLSLPGLCQRDTGVLVERAIGLTPAPAVVAAIHARAEGNPFFTGELARLVVSEGARTDDELVRSVGVPAGVRDVVRRRLGRLPPSTVEVLEAAAVIGREADLLVLAATSGRDVENCLDELEPALNTRLMVEVPDSAASFRFSHALVREVLLEEISTLRRARMHQKAADAIVDVAGLTDDTAEIVAEHRWASVPIGDRRVAATALELAADVALRRYAYESAEELLERVVPLRRSGGNDEADLRAELDAIVALAGIRRILHGYTFARKGTPLVRARELARLTGQDRVYAELLWADWAGASTACDFVVADALGAQLHHMADESDDPHVRAIGWGATGVLHWHHGRVTPAVEYLDKAMANYSDPGFLGSTAAGESQLLVTWFNVAMHRLAGDLDDDLEARLTAIADAQTAPYARAVTWVFGCLAGMVSNDVGLAGRSARRALAIDPSGAFSFYTPAAGMFLAWVLSELGDVEAAVDLFAQYQPRYRSTGVRTVMPLYISHYAVALARAGRLDEAKAKLDEAEATIQETGEAWMWPIVFMSKAEIVLISDGDKRGAISLLSEAVHLATEQGGHGLARRARSVADHLGLTLPGKDESGGDAEVGRRSNRGVGLH